MKYLTLTRLRNIIIPVLLGLVLAWLAVYTAKAGKPLQLGDSAALSTDASDVLEHGLRVLDSSAWGITLELSTPDFQFEAGMADAGPCQGIRVEGFSASQIPGLPRLPVKGSMVGIPPYSDPLLEIIDADLVTVQGEYEICPVPDMFTKFDPSGGVRVVERQVVRDQEAYELDSFSPTMPVELVTTGYIRSQRVAQLRFQPFQYNPVSGELRYYQRLRVRLSFSDPGKQRDDSAQQAAPLPLDEGPFEPLLRESLLNYDQALSWRAQPRPLSMDEGSQPPAYKVLVDQDGIYQVTYADLQAAGFPVDDIDPHEICLTNQGQDVAITIVSEGDGSFDVDDFLLFYGQEAGTRYTDVNVYWLTDGCGTELRMSEVDGTPTGTASVPVVFTPTLRVETNKNYQASRPSGPDRDRWYWNYVYAAGSPATKDYLFDLQHVALTPYSATVRGLFKGYDASPEHHTQVFLNEYLVDDDVWEPEDEYTFTMRIPQAYLLEGENIFKVKCPLDGGITRDIFFVNWFEVTYAHTFLAEDDMLSFIHNESGIWEYQISGFYTQTIEVYDITTPSIPVRILGETVEKGEGEFQVNFERAVETGRAYLVLAPSQWLTPLGIFQDQASDLRSSLNGVDYIVITHGDFYTDVLPLAERRGEQGLRTAVVDVQDVYDEFSHGLLDPEAIRDFLAYAYANWQLPAPSYVLLVGDGTYDFKDYKGYGESNYIPPYLADIDPNMGETAVDNRFVTVNGDDILPDLHIGRLPVKTRAEAAALVTKILDYETAPLQDGWNKKVLFVADNADDAGDFAALSSEVADHYLPDSYDPQKVYYKVNHPTAASVKAATIQAINEGRLVVNYVGHAAPYWWADEKLLDSFSDLGLLTNPERLPMMVSMTCLDGYFINPSLPDYDLSSLGESIVRHPDGGAVASWSPTGMGVASGHDFLNRGLYDAIFNHYVTQIGPATTQAKLYLYANTGGYRDLIETYILFGDPATRLPVFSYLYLPLVEK